MCLNSISVPSSSVPRILQYLLSIIIYLLYVFHIIKAICYIIIIKRKSGLIPIRKLEKQLFTCHRKGMVETMKKIIEKINEFCSEYYKSFAERI